MVNWLDILKDQVAKSSKADVAKRIGYSRTAVSLALSGNYKGSTDKLEAAVLETFTGPIECPFLAERISSDDCTDFRTRPIPQSSAAALRHWRACQACPLARNESEVRHAV